MWEYQDIRLVDIVWKVYAPVVHYQLKRSVTLHGTIHGSRAGRGTGTETLEEKLAHQLAGIAHESLFQISLGVRKAYDSLDRGRCMEILQGYGMG